MTLEAFVAPIVPGEQSRWDTFMAELKGPRWSEFSTRLQHHGIHMRTYLQHTPMYRLVIVTLEGEHPLEALAAMANADDGFTHWFVQQFRNVHGFDLRVPLENPPRLVVDSETIT
jgi:hypothetical protein